MYQNDTNATNDNGANTNANDDNNIDNDEDNDNDIMFLTKIMMK